MIYPEGADAFSESPMKMHREIRALSRVRAPRSVHKFVLELVKRIGLESSPVWVPVRPVKGASPNECFYNVAVHIKNVGGDVQHGWTVWQNANLLIEGEFHAVWVSPQGELIDITPKVDGETRILFVPDNQRKWQEVRVDNVRHPMTDRPEIHEFINVASEEVQFMIKNAVPGQPRAFKAYPHEYARFDEEKARLQHEMMKYVLPRSAPCVCESGRHFGNCCGKF